jgi:hypothetical protein
LLRTGTLSKRFSLTSASQLTQAVAQQFAQHNNNNNAAQPLASPQLGAQPHPSLGSSPHKHLLGSPVAGNSLRGNNPLSHSADSLPNWSLTYNPHALHHQQQHQHVMHQQQQQQHHSQQQYLHNLPALSLQAPVLSSLGKDAAGTGAPVASPASAVTGSPSSPDPNSNSHAAAVAAAVTPALSALSLNSSAGTSHSTSAGSSVSATSPALAGDVYSSALTSLAPTPSPNASAVVPMAGTLRRAVTVPQAMEATSASAAGQGGGSGSGGNQMRRSLN